jgi:acyl carrier protein
MHDVTQKLTKCFSAVFPELSPQEIVTASPHTLGAWDSLTAVTLMALIEQEFGIELEPNCELEEMSFENIQARVARIVENQIRAEFAHASTSKPGQP